MVYRPLDIARADRWRKAVISVTGTSKPVKRSVACLRVVWVCNCVGEGLTHDQWHESLPRSKGHA